MGDRSVRNTKKIKFLYTDAKKIIEKDSEYVSYKSMKLDNDVPLELFFDALGDAMPIRNV